MSQTSIEWTDHTLNPGIYGREEVSPACANCYAAKMAHRQVAQGNYPDGITTKRTSGVHWSGVVKVDFDAIGPAFDKLPKKKPARVFVTSMADLFHDDVPGSFIERVFVEMEARPHLTFQVLTKRPERIDGWWRASAWGLNGIPWPANVWIGTTVEDQRRADERIPHLLRVPAAVRFLSMEPLLEFTNVNAALFTQPPEGEPDESPEAGGLWTGPRPLGSRGVQWVIAGGESGPKARPSHPEWFRSLAAQCAAAGVAFHFKQWGEWLPEDHAHVLDDDTQAAILTGGGLRDAGVYSVPGQPSVRARMFHVGKHAAGRLLDGRTHDDFPEVTRG